MVATFNAKFKESAVHNATFTESPKSVRAGFDARVQINGASLSDDLPLMDGEASAGSSKKFSRSDHRHPHDSEKMNYMSAISNIELESILK